MLPSHRRISDVQAQEIELAADSGLQQRAAYEFLSREAGGRGFNHFKGGVIFGAAMLYDETADQAMAKALRKVMPEVYHGLCTWHLMQNGIKHLGNLMKGGSHFLRDFKSCMYQYEEVLDVNEIKIVPDQYILGRWTKNARSDVILDVKENEEGFLLVAKGLKICVSKPRSFSKGKRCEQFSRMILYHP
ncbi:protein FAR1-RELATED SEQUENCE 5-like [Senna tora]|uniref:Protein FAR1-RELATED SEQUENCE 5-like n=1 Tax=Senna tora TaxID=362788 RepID=A0A834SNV2_9FABA|nr:protein FAR1-RELATED SEQUENCE 5-like [Senna tora]